MKTNKSISLVIPAYNEEAVLEETVLENLGKLSKFTDKYEIIIVDDGSDDKSPEIAVRLSKEFNQVRVLSNLINLGFGISIVRGFKMAKGEIVFCNGADNPFDVDDLEK